MTAEQLRALSPPLPWMGLPVGGVALCHLLVGLYWFGVVPTIPTRTWPIADGVTVSQTVMADPLSVTCPV